MLLEVDKRILEVDKRILEVDKRVYKCKNYNYYNS